MIKHKELSDPNSCLNRAKDDEPVFVLIGRDVAAIKAITEWCDERIRLGKNQLNDPQIEEALELVNQFREYQERCKPTDHTL